MNRPPLLTLADISLTFGGNPLFEGVQLSVQPGDRVALVGRNGSGKSTLLKIMAGLVEADRGTRFVQPGALVDYMAQDPDLSGWETLGDYAASGVPEAERYRADIVMEGLKLNPATRPEAASGGERRRAALARIVAAEPELMLLDEPTNHLDIEAIGWLEEHLAQTRAAFVLISHDRAFLRRLTCATLWVDRGEVRRQERGFEGFEEWRDKTFEEEEQSRHKLDRLIKAEARWAVEGISARRKRNMGRVRRLQGLREERRNQIARTGVARMEIDSGPKSGKLVVEATDVAKAFGERSIIRDFSIRVMRGERVALVGPNGVGKTTLLNILTGQVAPDSGTIRIGTNLSAALFDQNRAQLAPEKSLWASLTEDPELGVSGRSDQVMVRGTPRHVVGYLKEFLFDERQARGPVSALSGGEKARLLLARIMARASNLLILDEPTNDLDVETLDLLQEILDDYDGTVLLVSHDRDFLDLVATTTIAMEGDGRATVYAGGWTDYRSQRAEGLADAPAAAAAAAKPKAAAPEPAAAPKPQDRLSYKQSLRLEALPAEMERVTAEIARLEQFLADPELFTTAPAKFQKATDGLVERQERLAAMEEEWLELEALREELEG
ncbi:ABC-F family ATP-binding cassette domain-containing protein [Oceanicella sp. SM1341]|uniref:ABC-F family ATP-binding cassette domain-containing protein n=1 Tax=Oceanicella sp. SM1341 TaxID=1548889 RepID=UPI000E523BA5|nr:ATP-binding cassette domain-containing protein [Oceanicella sp. SM1341]